MNSKKTLARRALQRGMTLVEIMVVVVIIGLIAGVVSVQVFGQLEDANIKTAQTQIKSVENALDLYRLSNRGYPSTAEGLGRTRGTQKWCTGDERDTERSMGQ